MNSKKIQTARPLAPEDIAPGVYVAVLKRVCEIPALLLCDPEPWEREGVLRIELTPPSDENAPLKVVSVCLPFVVVRKSCGERAVLDARLVRLAAVSEKFARASRPRERSGRANKGAGADG